MRREDRSLKQLWDLLVSGRLPKAEKSKDTYRREIDAIDEFLAKEATNAAPGAAAVNAFIDAQRAELTPDVVKRSKKVAAVLVEPVQGEGGVRMASARFMRKLRLLTRIYDVPLIFDEVQSGWGMTGKRWAHELFDLPCPPDVVTWAKKAQNGVLFVSEELATFFQEEKKFNTTWEGDSGGMVRLLAKIEKLDLDQVRRTGERAKAGLEALAREHREIIRHVRGVGVMLGFDVVRPDWSDPLRDRAFRRGLLLLPAGERTVRFYPRYDTEASTIDEALSILRSAIKDLVGGVRVSDAAPALRIRVGTLTIPVDTLELVDLTPETFEANQAQILQLEQERFDPESPLLKYPPDTLEATLKNPRAIGIGVARSRLGTPRGLRAGQRDRGSRRRRHQLGSPRRRERHVLSAGARRAALGAERRRTRELPAGHPAPSGDRRRVRVSVDAHRIARVRDCAGLVQGRRDARNPRQPPRQRHDLQLPSGAPQIKRKVQSLK